MGVRVAINFNTSEESAKALAATINKKGGEAFTVQADVRYLDQVKAMVDRVNDIFGGVDIMINNAGIIHDTLMMRMSDSAWDDVISTNLNSICFMVDY